MVFASNLPCVYVLLGLISSARYALNLHEFVFEGQNVKFTVNMLITCILYCAPEVKYFEKTLCGSKGRIESLWAVLKLVLAVCSFTSELVLSFKTCSFFFNWSQKSWRGEPTWSVFFLERAEKDAGVLD